jgi:prevent-host-death family protein
MNGSQSIGVFEAKNHFSEILERVQRGETVTITKHGKPVAQIAPPPALASVDERRAMLAKLEAAKAAFIAKHGKVEPWALADLRRMRDERGVREPK